jgi:hypothetical protein
MPAAGPSGSETPAPGPEVLSPRRLALRVTAALAALLTVLIAAGLTAGLELSRMDDGPEAAWAKSSGHDALWMGRIWVQGEYTQPGQRGDQGPDHRLRRSRAAGWLQRHSL